jgi:multidrug efflux pump subunit AcrA (membrane-fusion protein)
LATVDSAALQSQVTSAQASVDSATAKLSSDQTNGGSSAQLQSDQANLTAAQAQLASAQASLSGASLTAPIDGTVAAVNLTVGQQLSGTGASGTNLSGSGTGSGRTNSAGSSGSGSNGFGGGGGGGNNSSSSASSSSSSSSSTPQIQMISTGTYIVNVSVDDTQIGRIAAGQAATVTPSNAPANGRGGGGGFARFFGGGQNQTTPTTTDNSQAQDAQGALGGQAQTTTAQGTVTSVGAIATNTSGVSSFPVVITLNGTPQGFFPGATVNVAITYNQLSNVLQVPTLAITRSNGQSAVTVSQNGKKSQRTVTTGITSGGFTQITDGLSRGELVVVTIPTQVANRNGGTTGNRTGGGGGVGGGGGFRGGGGGAGGGGGFGRPGD